MTINKNEFKIFLYHGSMEFGYVYENHLIFIQLECSSMTSSMTAWQNFEKQFIQPCPCHSKNHKDGPNCPRKNDDHFQHKNPFLII